MREWLRLPWRRLPRVPGNALGRGPLRRVLVRRRGLVRRLPVRGVGSLALGVALIALGRLVLCFAHGSAFRLVAVAAGIELVLGRSGPCVLILVDHLRVARRVGRLGVAEAGLAKSLLLFAAVFVCHR